MSEMAWKFDPPLITNTYFVECVHECLIKIGKVLLCEGKLVNPRLETGGTAGSGG
jgi:hypothetical protein